MAEDADQIVIAANGAICTAPVGTTVQKDPALALSNTFRNLGLASEDGVNFGDTPSVESVMSWQRSSPSRRFVSNRERVVSTELQQWNDATVPTAHGGGEWVLDGSGIYRFDPPSNTDALDEVCLVIDWADGDRHFRWVGYKVSVTSGVEYQLSRTQETRLPVTFELNAADSGPDYNIYSDDPVFAAGGS